MINRNTEENKTVKAKITSTSSALEYGYEAKLHTSADASDTIENALWAKGYTTDFHEESDESGYNDVVSVFTTYGEFISKAEFMKTLRADVKAALKEAK